MESQGKGGMMHVDVSYFHAAHESKCFLSFQLSIALGLK